MSNPHFMSIANQIIPLVVKASVDLKLQSDNPIKLFCYIFMLKTSLPSKAVL